MSPPIGTLPGRLLGRLRELRTIGATERDGVCRRAYSPDDLRARSLAGEWMTGAGLQVHVDVAGNLIGLDTDAHRRTAPAVVIGSHLDTVDDGGWLDGAYGVVAAIEVAQTLRDAGVALPFPLAVVAFANEEGASGLPPFTGSRAFVGQRVQLTPGQAELLDRAGGQAALLAEGRAGWPGTIGACIELHIEQGPVLEHESREIGIVDAVTGRLTIEIELTGTANHAGTTPMSLRRDAAVAAAHVVLLVEGLARAGQVRVATVGRVEIEPGAHNVIAGRARLWADLRDVDAANLDAAASELGFGVERIARDTGVTATLRVASRVEPVQCDRELRRLIAEATDRRGCSSLSLTSGAGHDAQVLGSRAPSAMIFVPSEGGVSHSPDENTPDDSLVAGADVLLLTVLGAAGLGASGAPLLPGPDPEPR